MPPSQSSTACSICCEENKPNLVALTKCSHVSCSDCLVQWVTRVESTGQLSLPGCPFCRLPLSEEETHIILGRPFCPATAAAAPGSVGQEEEMDDLTRQLLEQLHVKPCPRCGAWIEKLPGGCDMMECLCGYRFCIGCGCPDARCGCTPDTHSFWDNVLDRNAGRTQAQEASRDEETGQINLAKHIELRKKKDKEDQVRRQRADKRQRQAYEIRTADPLVYYSAKWLFGTKTRDATTRMLQQLLAKPRIQMERQTKQRQQARDLRDVDELVSTARWLFLPSTKGAFLVLEQLKRRSTYYTRSRRKIMRQSEQQTIDALTYSAKWLFLPPTAAFRMLAQQRQAERTRQERDRKARNTGNFIQIKDGELPEGIIASGSWLYKKKTSAATAEHMKRLFMHQTKAARARFNRRFSSFGGGLCDNPGCTECCWDGRMISCKGSGSSGGEKENAMVLRLMFLSTEEDLTEEKQSIAKYGL
ncbi:expressed unknown protein [Seminavis robusta]|uniref:RING-type domain-containing protein n=1 Tax=Seminavis robusta TaxID=568900 RepID=A0A9N8HV13_9STRA|nr:expressed unknown protein [Seminavis robusta]|eukprot:Sro1914_g305050.1 n/a (474) ;mRNA; r:4826-6247